MDALCRIYGTSFMMDRKEGDWPVQNLWNFFYDGPDCMESVAR